MRIYSQHSYLISLASRLLLSDEGYPISSPAFHLGYLLLIPIRRVLSYFGVFSDWWQSTHLYTRCMDEVNQQIDVLAILQKILLLEKAVTVMLSSHQFEVLHLFGREKLEDAEWRRKKLSMEATLEEVELQDVIEVGGAK